MRERIRSLVIILAHDIIQIDWDIRQVIDFLLIIGLGLNRDILFNSPLSLNFTMVN